MQLINLVNHYFIAYGYYFLFFASLGESIIFLGIFLPGEVVVVAAGYFSAIGKLNLFKVLLLASTAGIIGNNISYLIGWIGGQALVEKLASKTSFASASLKKAKNYFDRHGHWAVFVGRYIAGLKAFITALAGAAKMNYFVFLIFSSLGMISWTLIAALAGYFFGQNLPLILKILRGFSWILALLAFIVLILIYLARRSRIRRKL
jgi:membrane-associated protein